MADTSTARTALFTDFWFPFLKRKGNPVYLSANMQAECMKAMLEWQIEGLDFLKLRFGKDVVLIDGFVKADEPAEFVSLVSDYLQEAVDDYSRETMKISNFSSRMAADAANRFKTQGEELTNDIRTLTSVVA